jgi:hypothetical protein
VSTLRAARLEHLPRASGDKTMTALFLLPGELTCRLAGLKQDNDHKQILRMFVNTLVWGATGIVIVLMTTL